MKKSSLAWVCCFLSCCFYACGDDSSNSGSGTAGDGDDGCSQCTASQVCKDNVCYDKDDPCLKCSDGQVCKDKACYDKDDPCLKCSDGQVCKDKACYDKADPCLACTSGQTCEDGVCKDTSGTGECTGEDCGDETACTDCAAPDTCVNGECVKCENVCGESCCGEAQTCDRMFLSCEDMVCGETVVLCGGFCCASGFVCDMADGCMADCAQGVSTRCGEGSSSVCCDNATQECLGELCVAKCEGTRCGEDLMLCCEGATPVCEDNMCKVACESENRCGEKGELCCNEGTVCVTQQCVKSGKACTKSSQCSFDEICEESHQVCIKEDEVESSCQVIPKFTDFTALQQWQWPKSLPGGQPSVHPSYIRVIVTPLVANLTDDNGDGKVDENDVPDVIFIAYSTQYGPDTQAPSVLRVISGDDGREIASSAPRYWTYPIDAVVADIDNDGKNEIVVGTNNHRGVINGVDLSIAGEDKDYIEALTVEPDPQSPTKYSLKTKYQIEMTKGVKLYHLSVADLDADGTPEVITNYGIVSVVGGKLEWRKGCENKSTGSLHAADLDGDGQMELVRADAILDNHCNVLVGGASGGNIAIADLMPDSEDAAQTGELKPEIVHAISALHEGSFEFWKVFKKKNEDGTATWRMEKKWRAPIPINNARVKQMFNVDCNTVTAESGFPKTHYCTSGGGSPVIADFNGDGLPDVGVAAGYYYIVYSNDGTPNGGKVLWAHSGTQDVSSKSTGSSVFDFEGDGKAEVVYSDETTLRIYTGMGTGVDSDNDGYPDPKIIWSKENKSATGAEYPIIVDVDNDGSTEIVLSSDVSPTMGVAAYEDPGGQWVRTRRIWNQHYYHVTNINEDGTVPVNEEPNWLHPKLNNYRQNVQPGGVYNAPNLVAGGLVENTDLCAEAKKLTLTATVTNSGSLGIKAGLSVKFYVKDARGADGRVLIGEGKVPTIIAPGNKGTASIQWDQKIRIDGKEFDAKSPVEIFFVVDEPTEGKQYGEFVECIEDDNQSVPQALELCPAVVN